MAEKIKSIKTKFLWAFAIVPVLPAGVFLFYLISTAFPWVDSVTNMEEELLKTHVIRNVEMTNRVVSFHIRDYLAYFPKSTKELLNDEYFGKIAVQPVLKTGYTAVWEYFGEDSLLMQWHPQKRLSKGFNMYKLKDKLPDFWLIFKKATPHNDRVEGFYKWQEETGEKRDKFMVCEYTGTRNYMVVSTAYLDQFTKPIEDISLQNKKGFSSLRMIAIVIGIILIAGGALAGIYISRNIVTPIEKLTGIADRFSKGDINVDIDIKSSDEIGILAKAFKLLKETIKKLIGG